MTRKQLDRFISRRNRSEFSSNLQFQIDANACGFKLDELGEGAREGSAYVWATPHGRLVERGGRLSLETKIDKSGLTDL